ncbi:MAG: hypothetical protein HOW73_16780 [Polyangiaceae bacterium]|nr:hypothetical protein [Polyangiaceae bacterium]
MLVSVMQIRRVRVRVLERIVPVRVAVRLGQRHAWRVVVPMMLVVHVSVLVLDGLVLVKV